jgi:hypothetical protein
MINGTFHVPKQLVCSCSLEGTTTGEVRLLKVNETFASKNRTGQENDKGDDAQWQKYERHVT